MVKRVLIGAGHRNAQGGNEFEADLNGRKVRAILDLFDERGGAAKLGFELRNYTPDRGLGWSPLDLNAVPLTGFAHDWRPDLMVEMHSEGAGASVRGAFSLYPDWGDDVDRDVIAYGAIFPDELNRVVPAISVRTISGRGVMSEKRSGVGIQGHRLGVFRDTARFAEVTSRIIFEAGSHDHPAEREAMGRHEFPRRHAEAFLSAVALFLDRTSPGWRSTAAGGPPEYTPAILPALADKSDTSWAETIDAGRPVRIGGIDWQFERKVMRARRAAVCRSAPDDKSGKTRRNLDVGEEVTVILKGKHPKTGVNWRVTKYGTCIRASALSAV